MSFQFSPPSLISTNSKFFLQWGKAVATTFIALTVFSNFLHTEAANIAMFNLLPFYSHKSIFYPMAATLINRGHNVTLYTTLPIFETYTGLKEIYMEKEGKEIEGILPPHFTEDRALPNINYGLLFYPTLYKSCEIILKSDTMQELRQKKKEFDISMIETLNHDCFLPLVDEISKTIVYLSTVGLPFHRAWEMGVPLPPYVPNQVTAFNPNMTFIERLLNAGHQLCLIFLQEFNVVPSYDPLIKKYVPNSASIKEIENKIPLIFLNSHQAFDYPAPLTPMAKYIGGIHIKPAKELPEDLETFIDRSGTEGFIYVSFGSAVQESYMPPHAKKALLNAFAQIRQRVVWKFHGVLPRVSDNVKVLNWAPQNDILAHPKIKAFITHGGLFSFIEAVYYAVPLVGLPVFADQPYNVERAQFYGIGKTLSWPTITAEEVVQALDTVMNDSSYKTNMLKRQRLFRDNPIHPREEAAYWVEYVLRHEGSLHLRLPTNTLNWFQYYLFDVAFFVVGVLILILVFLWKLFAVISDLFASMWQGKKKGE